MKVVRHDAETKDLCEVKPAEKPYRIEEMVFFSVSKRKSIQSGSRDDMVHGRGVGTNKPGDARHGKTSGIGVQEEKGRQISGKGLRFKS
jgi:hypothetical protein